MILWDEPHNLMWKNLGNMNTGFVIFVDQLDQLIVIFKADWSMGPMGQWVQCGLYIHMWANINIMKIAQKYHSG